MGDNLGARQFKTHFTVVNTVLLQGTFASIFPPSVHPRASGLRGVGRKTGRLCQLICKMCGFMKGPSGFGVRRPRAEGLAKKLKKEKRVAGLLSIFFGTEVSNFARSASPATSGRGPT